MKLKDTAKIFVHSLVAPDTKSLVDEELSRKKRAKGSRWDLENSISPADLYIYLKARFGPPNGVIMIARSPHSDNFIQWHYTLKSGSAYLDILGLNTRTEFWLSDYPGLTSEDWTALIDAIKSDFKRIGPKLKEVRSNLELWRLFYNPYHRIDNLVLKYYEELKKLSSESLELPPELGALPNLIMKNGVSWKDDIEEFKRRISECSKNFARAKELSICLRLLCPVWAEAFINFIIFILAREEIKNDKRLYQDFLRKDIDVRVKLLHINCFGFEKKIDSTNKAFKDLQSLMNERNDLLHGNVDPDKLSYETVYFDITIPLFTEPQGLARNSLGQSLVGIEPEVTLDHVHTVRAFIDFILSHIQEPIQKELRIILSKRDLGWRPEKRKVGVLFDDFIMEGFAR